MDSLVREFAGAVDVKAVNDVRHIDRNQVFKTGRPAPLGGLDDDRRIGIDLADRFGDLLRQPVPVESAVRRIDVIFFARLVQQVVTPDGGFILVFLRDFAPDVGQQLLHGRLPAELVAQQLVETGSGADVHVDQDFDSVRPGGGQDGVELAQAACDDLAESLLRRVILVAAPAELEADQIRVPDLVQLPEAAEFRLLLDR